LNEIERLIEFDFVRATESAALNTYHWLGKGDPLAAHAAAVDALKGTLDVTSVIGTVVLGDGMNPQSEGIQENEILGTGEEDSLAVQLAILPIDGVELVSRGEPGALCVLVAASSLEGKRCFAKIPCKYMEKMAYGPQVAQGPGQLSLDASVRDNLEIIAMKLGKRIQDLSVVALNRRRHEALIGRIRKAGASVRLIGEGDLAACLAPCFPDTGVDVYMGTGGGAEAVMAAAAIKCIGGEILARLAPMDDQEEQTLRETLSEEALKKQYRAEDLAHGDNVIFCATGISDSNILRGIKVQGKLASTYSVVMRTRFRTVRYIKTDHDLSRKKIRLHSTQAETSL